MATDKKFVNQKQPSSVNQSQEQKSVDSSNPQEKRFQPTDTHVKADSGLDADKKAAREAELAEQAPQTRLQTGADEKAEQPAGNQTADSVNPLEAKSFAATVQPTATKEEIERAKKAFDKKEQEEAAKVANSNDTNLRTMTTEEKDAVTARTGLEAGAIASSDAQPNRIGADSAQVSNKGSRKAF